MKALKRSLWTLLAILFIAYLPQFAQCFVVNSAKVGRVVDADTGEGISAAYVVVAGDFYAQNLFHGSTHLPTYKVVALTDEQGNYEIPATWAHSHIAPPFPPPFHHWSIAVYKPGYVVDVDERALGELADVGAGVQRFPSPTRARVTSWEFTRLRVASIALKAVAMNDRQAVLYYRSAVAVLRWGAHARTPAEVGLVELGQRLFAHVPCALPADASMDSMWAMAYGDFAASYWFFSTLEDLEGVGPQEDSGKANFHAGNVCAALSATRDPRPLVPVQTKLGPPPEVATRPPEAMPRTQGRRGGVSQGGKGAPPTR